MRRNVLQWMCIVGLAYVFALFGVEKIVRPLLWIQWIPPWFEGVFGLSRETWLTIFGLVEVLLAGLLLIPQRILQRIVAVLMTLHLVAVLTQTGLLNDVGVRDTGLLFIALGLVFSF